MGDEGKISIIPAYFYITVTEHESWFAAGLCMCKDVQKYERWEGNWPGMQLISISRGEIFTSDLEYEDCEFWLRTLWLGASLSDDY
jgi:hypothetical protein